MIGTGNPQRGVTLHAMVANHEVFNADEHGVTEMQFTGHIWRRDGDDKRFDTRVKVRLVWVIVRFEVFARLPHRVDARFGIFEVVGFG